MMVYIIDQLIDLHNHYSSETLQYILAEYFLLNLNNLEKLRLNEVAKETHVSSSSIIRFCKSNGYDTFSSFVDILYLDVRKLINKFDYMIMHKRNIDIQFNIKEKLQNLAINLKKSKKIILYGLPKYCSVFNELIKYLLIHEKNIIECKSWNAEARNLNFEKLDENDIIIIIDPHYNIEIFLEEIETTIGGIDKIRYAKGKKYFFGDGNCDFMEIQAIKLFKDDEFEYYKSCFDYMNFILYELMRDK